MSEKRAPKIDAKKDKILDAQKGVGGDAQAESGTLAVVPGNTYKSTRYPPDRNYPRKKN